MLNELKEWFALPKLIITAALFCIFYLVFSSGISLYALIVVSLGFVIWGLYKGVRLNRAYRRRKETTNKKWLLEEMIFKQAGVFGLVLVSHFFNVFNYSDWLFSSNYSVIVLSLVMTLIYLMTYISFDVIPNKAEKLLQETYPSFNLM